jgi:peptidyl-prolyl cis-trans isomerase A (cyclophilin A)
VDLAEGSREWKDPRTRELVKRPLYNGTTFHRVIPGFMIQGGDPLGTGTGGPGYRFDDEPQPGVVFERPGVLAMANAGPNTNGSQFFITDSVPTHLNGKHTIFGGNCESMEVVRAIAGVRADRRNKPIEDVVVQRVRIRRGD